MKSAGSPEERSTGGEAGKRRDLRMKGSIPALETAIATAAAQSEAARLSGMSVKSVQRRLQGPAIVLAIDEARAELTRQALSRISSLRDLALDRVGTILADTESPAGPRARVCGASRRLWRAADLSHTARQHERDEDSPRLRGGL